MQDRIKQMAEEATYYADAMDGSGQMAGRIWSDVRDEHFAKLVAEDCAKVSDGKYDCGDLIRARYGIKG